MDIPLTVHGLTKLYGTRAGIAEASFEVRPGEIVGLLGPNGCGKSTTLHCITDYHNATSGEVLIAGHPHDRPSAKSRLGFLPDDLPLPESLSGRELLMLHAHLRPGLQLDTAYDLLEVFDLMDHLDRYVGDYSHGMKRKLQLVLALAHRPTLLVLDEPLRGLDPEAAILTSTVISSFAGSAGGVLIATHDLAEAERTCDSVVIVSQGRVVAQGAPADLKSEHGASSLEDVFLTLTGIRDGLAAKLRRLTLTLDINHPLVLGGTS
ncbi:MAG: ABC transporter ATP-binding protein [Micropruina sp.]|nr:ABC transporter ATP-binding protein [Micropruina sp.]